MTTKKLTKLIALYLPYILLGLVATNLGEAWRLAEGKELGERIMSMMGTIPMAFANPLPSLHPLDLLVGLCCGAGLRLAVYLRGKNAKKYRHGMEYGSARWGTPKDIEPFIAPKFEDNIILTKTERLMMSNRPPDPKNARNKNVLVVGGSGSGKTRFWLKPNLLQCHSSYVVTDPKGSIVVECGNALLKNGYKLKILNTINFKKSIHISKSLLVFKDFGYQLTTTKESNIRDVDVAPEYMDFLKEYYKYWKSQKKLMGGSWQKSLDKKSSKYAPSLLALRGTDFVICNDHGFPINPDSYGALVRRIGQRAGIEGLHPHMFRHTFVSILLSNPEIGVATVAAEAGHAQPSTTLAIYTQVYDKRRKEIRNQMSKELYE